MQVIPITSHSSRADIEEMLRSCMCVSLHCPLTPKTRGLIGRAELAMMPQGSMIINYARGEVIDKEVQTSICSPSSFLWPLEGCTALMHTSRNAAAYPASSGYIVSVPAVAFGTPSINAPSASCPAVLLDRSQLLAPARHRQTVP